MRYTIVNDLHFGLRRKVPAAYLELQFEILKQALAKTKSGDALIILGDLFDSPKVDTAILLRLASMLSNSQRDIILVAGNHDLCRVTEERSAFDFLGTLLEMLNCSFDIVKGQPYELSEPGYWIVPHLANQTLFDEALASIPDGAVVLAHCNYENPFAAEKDHSLNLTKAQAARFQQVVLGHEHNLRVLDNVICLGSQLPTSISDCTCNKFFHIMDTEAAKLNPWLDWSPTWTTTEYAEVDWRDLQGTFSEQYIRVTGEALPAEAPEVLKIVNKFVESSRPMLISNSVTVAGVAMAAVDFTDTKVFDPMAEFLKILPAETKDKLLNLNLEVPQ